MVVLESMACGIPVVATEVGSCRELLEGRPGEDRDFGAAGRITSLADPGDTARALLELREAPQLRREMGRSGRRRVERYYRQELVREAYLDLYRNLLHGRD